MSQLGFFERVNNIIYFVSNPCNAPWAVYFETSLPALKTAIKELIIPQWDDVVRGYARPKGVRTGRHFRKKRGYRGFFSKHGIPEVGDEIGKALPGAEDMKHRGVTQGVRNLWLLDGVIQRVLWYWLIAEVTVDFFHNWESALHETEFCRASGFGGASSQSFGEVSWFAVGNQWTSPPINNKLYEEGFAFAWSGAHNNGGFPFEWSASAEVSVNPVLPGGSFEMRHWDPFRLQWVEHEAEVGDDGKSRIVMHGYSLGDSVILMYRTNGGGFLGTGTQVTFGRSPIT